MTLIFGNVYRGQKLYSTIKTTQPVPTSEIIFGNTEQDVTALSIFYFLFSIFFFTARGHGEHGDLFRIFFVHKFSLIYRIFYNYLFVIIRGQNELLERDAKDDFG
jgi:hypothetical protein